MPEQMVGACGGNIHLDPRMPARDECVLRDVLERRAADTPDKIFALFEDGSNWTYSEALSNTIKAANALRTLGVAQGDAVLAWMPNGPEILRVWFGVNYLGAVFVPINLAYKGGLLAHVIRVSGARLAVVHGELLDRLDDIDTSQLATVVVGMGKLGDRASSRLEVLGPDSLRSDDETAPILDRPIAPWDTQSIIYTSGTTGPSKGVLSSYVHLHAMSWNSDFLRSDDRFLVNLPYFHVGGTYPTYAMLVRGGSIAVVTRFETGKFWMMVRQNKVTTTIVLGSMASFLLGQASSEEDRSHSLRTVLMVPYGEPSFRFAERFGSEVHTHFNMTEISMPLVSGPNPGIPGIAGRRRAGVELRIVDENDCEVAVDTVGELIVRTDCPWAMNHGYAKAPEATAQAWRNGWFHTGDAFRVDANGNYFFVDRLKDAIRRRGENISSFEVETELCAHPSVREAAALAFPSEHGEDEVLAVLTLRDDANLDPAELIAFLKPRMPHFMVPRYVWIIPELPRTPTQKVQKATLRALAADATLWDREAAGIIVRGQRLNAN